jgi:NADPH-dependent 2,4-dienoyl-CoA reductase/sulfur reductase-like enzyme/rhodanese-related sulfurtransferase
VDALLDNALKYTPAHGRIEVAVTAPDARQIELSVADSGVGIPQADRQRVFEPFVRADTAAGSARPGTGLGLSLVKAVIEAAGGRALARKAALGGAEIVCRLPRADAAAAAEGEHAVTGQMKVVLIGGVAAGPKVAAKVVRLAPDADVTVVERGTALAYAGCGLAYYVSGVVSDQKDLLSTALGAVRDPVFFQQVKHVRILNHAEALEIDRKARRVRVRDLSGGKESWLPYDKLVLATGTRPVVPPIPGVDLENIFSLHGVRDAEGIKALLARGKAHDVVILGGGLIGVEATEALVTAGCRVTIIEKQGQILPMLDWEIARLVERHMESRGVKVLTHTEVRRFQGATHVTGAVTDGGVIPADMVITGIGVKPAVDLAVAAGIDLGPTGAIRVDERMATNDPDIFAAGDCAEQMHLVTGKPCHIPLGSTANKQGRVAAVNLCGGADRFPGVLGSTVCKVFDHCVGRTGLSEAQAREHGYAVTTVLAPAPDRAHYMPDARQLLLKLVVDSTTRRLLGAQTAGPGAGDKRIDVAAMAITAHMTVDQLANADLCYAPPYAPAMDNLITAANVARNKLDGLFVGIPPMAVHEMIANQDDFFFLDARTPDEFARVRLPGATLVPLSTLRGRLAEIPRNKPIVAFCQISLRGYEAALILKAAGYDNVRVLDGGVAMWPYEKLQ